MSDRPGDQYRFPSQRVPARRDFTSSLPANRTMPPKSGDTNAPSLEDRVAALEATVANLRRGRNIPT